jgi:hypothetical protein
MHARRFPVDDDEFFIRSVNCKGVSPLRVKRRWQNFTEC